MEQHWQAMLQLHLSDNNSIDYKGASNIRGLHGWGRTRFIKYKYKYKNLDFSNTNTNILLKFDSNTNTNTSIQIQIQYKYVQPNISAKNCSDPK